MQETALEGYGWNWNTFWGSKECLQSNRRDLHKLDFVLKLIPKSYRRVAIQAGGNLGLFPKRLSTEFQVVYTFEPDPDNFNMLCKNAPEKNILKLQGALGAYSQGVNIVKGSETHTHEGTNHVEGVGTVPMLALDEFNLAVCDLLYLDIEGYESDALRGATITLGRTRPLVVAEFNEVAERRGCKLETFLQFMQWRMYVPIFRLYTDYVFVHKNEYNVRLIKEQAPSLAHINGAVAL